jgi:ADP-L-glycero-D-manno-heptose 6-epimerase
MRDFVYVNDICKIAYHLLSAYTPGVYDLGSGTSRSFEEVADCVISHYGSGTKEYISMPEDLRLQYQTDTKADLCGLQSIGIFSNMTSLEAGVKTFKITQESAL